MKYVVRRGLIRVIIRLMTILQKIILTTLTVLVFLPISPSMARRGKISVDSEVKTKLNQILKAANELHSACFSQNEPLVETKLKSLLTEIGYAQKSLKRTHFKKTHIIKMLEATKGSIQVTQMNNGKTRMNGLKDTFKNIVQMSKVYSLDKYRTFFCRKDKSIWIQKSWKAKNPIHPVKFTNCGQLVR